MTSFESRICEYIREHCDLSSIKFAIDGQDADLEDVVVSYVAAYNENVDLPFNDESDDDDVASVGWEMCECIENDDHTYGYNSKRIDFIKEENE